MFWFKQCPRCRGDLVTETHHFGTFLSCMQCGLCKDVTSEETDPSTISLEPIPAPAVTQPETGTRRRLSHGGRHSYRSLREPNVQSMAS